MANQNPEQIARDEIDAQLTRCGWIVQNNNRIDFNAGIGIAVREYQTEIGPADYVLFINRIPVGIIEAKREEEGQRLSVHEEQAYMYANAKLKYINNTPLPFIYISNGKKTNFTDCRDAKPRAREVFTFHRPETLDEWWKKTKSLRNALLDLGTVPEFGLRRCQTDAITNLEKSLKENKHKALIQMATGSGKTYTAVTTAYRLLKLTDDNNNNVVRRILFLVDTKNLGVQAEEEFKAYQTPENRVFTELYGVHRIQSRSIPHDSQIYICTIQRLYAMLKGEELDEAAEEINPNEIYQNKKVPPVEYSEHVPIEFFDFIIIDECHRSIYNLWKQVLEYFDAFQIGLTATPDARTYAYFEQNMVSEYSHEMAITDGVNVGHDVYIIETAITKHGGTLWKGEYIEKRELLSRKRRMELQDEDEVYSGKQLDKDIVNPNQIKQIITTFKEQLPQIFADRYDEEGKFEVPKTLIFAKSDSHADDIVKAVRDIFNEKNKFCQKVTYRTETDPQGILADFRTGYFPRIAVTVDMIATGTDVKPLEVLLFMRDVKSRNYFEQMKGRGTRVLSYDDLKMVTPSAQFPKDRFVIVDAIGVTKSLKTDSRPLERKPGVPLKDLLYGILMGGRDEDLYTSLANRLIRLEKRMTEKEKNTFTEKTKGIPLNQVVKDLLNAYNPDTREDIEEEIRNNTQGEAPAIVEKEIQKQWDELCNKPARIFTGEINEFLEHVRKVHEQKIDILNPDTVLFAGWDTDNTEKAGNIITDFKQWVENNKDTIIALQLFYGVPYKRRELTLVMVREILEKLRADKPALAPSVIWRAYEIIDKTRNDHPKTDLTALVALIRRVCGIDSALTAYDKTVDKNYQQWILRKNAGKHNRFTPEQTEWLRMIKEHIATSFHIEKDDLDYTPFDAHGGLGRMYQLFGNDMELIMEEMNEQLAA